MCMWDHHYSDDWVVVVFGGLVEEGNALYFSIFNVFNFLFKDKYKFVFFN